MTLERRVINIYDTPYTTYDLEGPVQEDMQLLNISYSKETGQGWYVIRMAPGAASIPHTHESREEYLILELMESIDPNQHTKKLDSSVKSSMSKS